MKKQLSKINLLIMLVAIIMMPRFLFAATLELSSEGGTRGVKELFTVNVVVSGGGEDINATTGKIVYDKTRLTLKSIAIGESAISFWVVPPKDVNGEIDFEGVILSRVGGLKQKSEVMRLIFETKSSGQAKIYFTEGSVLKDDGRATNILDKFVNTSVLIKSGAPKPPIVTTDNSTPATIALIDEEYSENGEYILAILEYPTRVSSNERIALKGIAAANDEISLNMAIGRPNSIGERLLRILRNDPGMLAATVETDKDGSFTHTFNESLVAGVYSAWAEKESPSVGGENKIKSSEVMIEIKYGTFYKIWIWLVNALLLIIPVALLGIIVFVIFWRGRREIISAERFIHKGDKDQNGK